MQCTYLRCLHPLEQQHTTLNDRQLITGRSTLALPARAVRNRLFADGTTSIQSNKLYVGFSSYLNCGIQISVNTSLLSYIASAVVAVAMIAVHRWSPSP
ncbi:hypothetical protein EJB05_34007 [Eragrostis curvula]|uniref:Uncharacterized protein n=1 Tax=Eragrostis curvula TaxID=38414 RepID=A0A5J9U337_9POAL|nr:hypothetical protein EJB05_34007 [Eragrostis curvula]